MLQEILPWRYRPRVWITLFIAWGGAVLCGVALFGMDLFFAGVFSGVFAICGSAVSNFFLSLRSTLAQVVGNLGLIATVFATPVGALGGWILFMVPLVSEDLVYNETTRPRYFTCDQLPGKDELEAAIQEGFDVNGTCCLETMIGACSMIARPVKNFRNFDAILIQGEKAKDDVHAYVARGARLDSNAFRLAVEHQPSAILALFLSPGRSCAEIAQAVVIDGFTRKRHYEALMRHANKGGCLGAGFTAEARKEFISRMRRFYEGYPSHGASPFVDAIARDMAPLVGFSAKEIRAMCLEAFLRNARVNESSKTPIDTQRKSLRDSIDFFLMAELDWNAESLFAREAPNSALPLELVTRVVFHDSPGDVDLFSPLLKKYVEAWWRGEAEIPKDLNHLNCADERFADAMRECRVYNRLLSLNMLRRLGKLNAKLPLTVEGDRVDLNDPFGDLWR